MFYAVIVLTLMLLTSCYINFLFVDDIVDQEAPIHLGHSDSQSYVYEQMKEFDSSFRADEDDDDEESVAMKIAIHNNTAYWVSEEGGLLTAPVDEDGEVIRSMGKEIDVHALTTKEVSLLMDILDALKEANDDSGNSGQ